MKTRKYILLIAAALLTMAVVYSQEEWNITALLDTAIGIDIDQLGNFTHLPADVDLDKKMYYPMSKSAAGYGVAYVPDFSSNGINGTTANQVFWTNVFGGCYQFYTPGVSHGRITADNLDVTNASFSLSVWCYLFGEQPDASGPNTIGVLMGKGAVGAGAGYSLYVIDEAPAWQIKSGAHNVISPGNLEALSYSNWYHLAITYDRSGDGVLYRNGVETQRIDITSVEGESIANAWSFGIGFRHNVGFGFGFWGLIDDPLFVNGAMTSNEVNRLYLSQSTNGTGVH